MAINPRELRIGNWVRHSAEWSYRQPDNGPYSEFDFQWEERDWYAIGGCTLDFELIKPIPLTEELLVKGGFEKKEGIFGPKYSRGYFCIHTSKDKRFVFCWDDFIKEIKYIHSLQNLFYSLTGEELDFSDVS